MAPSWPSLVPAHLHDGSSFPAMNAFALPSLPSSPSSSSSSLHKMLSKARATSFSSPTGAPSHSNFARSALSDLLPADATKKQANPSSSPSSCIQNYAQSPLIRNNWVSNTFFESSRNDHSKENRENRKEEREEREQERQGIDVVRLSSSILKRKRPAKLAIPELGRLASFGKVKHFGLPRQEDFSPEAQSHENEIYGVCAKKGRKEYMEDTHLALTDFQEKPGQVGNCLNVLVQSIYLYFVCCELHSFSSLSFGCALLL